MTQLDMSEKQLYSQAKLGRKVSCLTTDGDDITGFIAGIDIDHLFLVSYDKEADYPGTGSSLVKSLLRRSQIVTIRLWDLEELDAQPEHLIKVVQPFRNVASAALDNAGKRRD